VQSWCDTLLPGQLLYKFESNYISVISPSGKTEQIEGDAIVNRFPYGNRRFTTDEVVSELGLLSTMPSESCRRRFLFYGKVWSPKAKFDADFKVPQAAPLSKKALEMTTTILSKWFASSPIPRKRKRMGPKDLPISFIFVLDDRSTVLRGITSTFCGQLLLNVHVDCTAIVYVLSWYGRSSKFQMQLICQVIYYLGCTLDTDFGFESIQALEDFINLWLEDVLGRSHCF
jgi:hypothetical protein